MTAQKIVITTSSEEDALILYSALSHEFEVVGVVIEKSIPKTKVFKRRIKNLGMVRALGQALFVVLMTPVLRLMARKRLQQLGAQLLSGQSEIPSEKKQYVDSLNDESSFKIVSAYTPTHIVVYGTRLLSKKYIKAVGVPIINIHLGINPRYRGGNGAYWALLQNDPEHCGVTVHLIDPGIDTGDVLARGVIQPMQSDSFVTYPLIQLRRGLELLGDVLEQDSLLTTDTTKEPSAVWYHPTLWGYVWGRITRGVK